MKSAHDQIDKWQKKLAHWSGFKHPLFPKENARLIANCEKQLEYWTALARAQDKAAMQDFGTATGLKGLGKEKKQSKLPASAPFVPPPPPEAVPSPFSSPAVIGSAALLAVAVLGALLT
jgi:hypothetical protein